MPTDDLNVYAGKRGSDKIGGVDILRHPKFLNATRAAVADPVAQAWIQGRRVPQNDPFISRIGDYVIVSGCETHGCGPHQWAVYITPDGSRVKACYFDEGRDARHAVWSAPNGVVRLGSPHCEAGKDDSGIELAMPRPQRS